MIEQIFITGRSLLRAQGLSEQEVRSVATEARVQKRRKASQSLLHAHTRDTNKRTTLCYCCILTLRFQSCLFAANNRIAKNKLLMEKKRKGQTLTRADHKALRFSDGTGGNASLLSSISLVCFNTYFSCLFQLFLWPFKSSYSSNFHLTHTHTHTHAQHLRISAQDILEFHGK